MNAEWTPQSEALGMLRASNLFTLSHANYSYRKQKADYGQICVLHVSTCVCLHVFVYMCLFVYVYTRAQTF